MIEPSDIKILLVDDDNEILRFISRLFRRMNYEVCACNSGREAIDKFSAEKPDIVITDLKMPEVSGLQVLEAVRQAIPNLPVLIISGMGTLDDVVEALKLGAWDYIIKPALPETLSHAVMKALERKELLDERENYHRKLEDEIYQRTEELRNRTEQLEKANAKLIQSEGRHKALLDAIPDVILQHDADQQVIDWQIPASEESFWKEFNPNSSLDGIIVNLLNILPKSAGNRWKEAISASLKGNTIQSFRFSLSNSKVEKYFEIRIVGCVENTTLSILRDITQRIKMEEKHKLQERQLIQADKMITLGTLVTGVAHEINNPNNYIRTNAVVLKKFWEEVLPILHDYNSQKKIDEIAGAPFENMGVVLPEICDSIIDGADRIKRIILNLKDYARHEDHSQHESIDLNLVMEKSIMMLDNVIKKSTDNFFVKYHSNLPKIQGDFLKLEQVMINLLLNACQALTDRKQQIKVHIYCDRSQKCDIVEIRDEGCGISQENLPHIIDPFFTTNSSIGGTGMGLSVSLSIIRQHNAEMIFESRERSGTKVLLTFPTVNQD